MSGRKLTPVGAFFLLLKTNWGIGVMAMPYLLRCAGTLTGAVMFVVSMLMILDAISRLDAAQRASFRAQADGVGAVQRGTYTRIVDPLQEGKGVVWETVEEGGNNVEEEHGNLRTYIGIIEQCLGLRTSRLAVACIFIGSLGSCIAYIEFIEDNMTRYVGMGVPKWGWNMATLAVVTPLCLLKSIAKMSQIGLVGVACGVWFVTMVVFRACEMETAASVQQTLRDSPLLSTAKLPIAFGIAAFVSEGVVVLWPQVSWSLGNVDRPYKGIEWQPVMNVSLTAFTVIYLGVALAGYSLYKDQVKAELTLSMSDNTTDQIAAIAYSLALVPTFVVVFFMGAETLEASVENYYGGPSLTQESRKSLHWRFRIARVFFCVMAGVIAYGVPNFGDFISLIGAALNSIVCYALPNLAYIYGTPETADKTVRQKAWSWFMVAYAVLTGVVGTISSVSGLLGKS